MRRRSISVESAIEIANLAEAALAENEFSISASAVLQLVHSRVVRPMIVNLSRSRVNKKFR
jgi:hypothetical protein